MKKTFRILDKESQLNALLRKKKGEEFAVLFYSEWDSYSQQLIEKLKDVSTETTTPPADINACSSWNLPHGFVIFKVTQTPCLILAKKNGRIRKIDYLPHIYNFIEGGQEF